MTRPVLYTGDIFRLQERGGITRYFQEMIPRLRRPAYVVAGLHQSQAIRERRLPLSVAAYMRGFRLSPRPRGIVNRWIDALCVKESSGVILHATYYRDPATLPRSLPLVLSVYDMAHERFPTMFRRRWWNSEDPARWKAAICERADRIVCISESTRRDLVELLGAAESKTRVIHCGSPSWNGIESRAVLGITRPFFLWVGERHTYKNFSAALLAWASSGAAGDTSLLCVGGGSLRETERAAIAARGAAGRVRQRNLSDAELKWTYERAAGLLYTSLCEGFGLPVLEAMSLGCPVVAANGSSLPEVAGDAAIYVEASDPDSIRSGIEHCLAAGRSSAQTERLKARAATFSWDTCAAAHEALYGELD